MLATKEDSLVVENEKRYLSLENIDAYKRAFELSNNLWDIIIGWDIFAKDTIGKQFVRSTDSISANIAEGFGHFNKKEKIRFYRYARASAYECADWLKKAKARSLIDEATFQNFYEAFKGMPKTINALIKFTNDKLKD